MVVGEVYGLPNPSSKNGLKNALRDYSRVLEIDPITLEIVWEFTPESIKAATSLLMPQNFIVLM